jgi:two-component system chemotaxis response regulator CheB
MVGTKPQGRCGKAVEAVVVGASAGAVDALSLILPELPPACSFPVVVVVHVPSGRSSLLAQIFRDRCALRVEEPTDKEPVSAGTIWFAPPGYHLLIERNHAFALSIEGPVKFSRPSIDVLFESAADAYGESLCGVVLTGANDDGAEGLSAIARHGGLVVVQDPSTAEAKEMPKAAILATKPHVVLGPAEIGRFLASLSGGAP